MTLSDNQTTQRVERDRTSEEDTLRTIAPPAGTPKPRRGFLPIKTNTFDRVFISTVCLIAIHLLWMRFLEAALPLGIATIISLILAYVIIRYG